MQSKILWIGGWASNLSCWQSTLETLYPNFIHEFLDAHAINTNPDILYTGLKHMPANGIVAAWSLGSLLLHQALIQQKVLPHFRMVSICPIFDFCESEGPWSHQMVSKMNQKLRVDRNSVLADFWKLLKHDSLLNPLLDLAWHSQALNYSQEGLSKGLLTLKDIQIDESKFPFFKNHIFLASEKDPVTPRSLTRFPNSNWFHFQKGHLPFLEYPELLTRLFNLDFNNPSMQQVKS